MVKVNVNGCDSFVTGAQYKEYVEKALAAYDTLQGEKGAGNDFLGWKTLPIDIDEKLICEFEAIRDDWRGKGVNLVIAIGIGRFLSWCEMRNRGPEPQFCGAGDEGGLRRQQPFGRISRRTS